MAYAKFRKVYGKVGSGRFVISEGVAPSTYLLPHPGLPTWYYDGEDNRFEVVIPMGTILSLVVDANGDSRVVPANGTAAAMTWGDTMAGFDPSNTGATPTGTTASVDTVTVPAKSMPVGCAQYDLYRPFDKGTSQGAGWITKNFVEWPMVLGLNHDVTVNDYVRADNLGRPVRFTTTQMTSDPYLAVGKVIELERFATNFDDGLLSYMQLPSDPGGLKDVYALTKAGPFNGKLGIRANLDQVNVVGAFRVNLNL